MKKIMSETNNGDHKEDDLMADQSVVKEEPEQLEHSEEFQKFVTLGFESSVASSLDSMIQSGYITKDDLDSRALDGLKEFLPEDALAVLEEMTSGNLENIKNKSAYICGIMKSYRQKRMSGIVSDANTTGMYKAVGPDEESLKAILTRTGYSHEVTSGQRKYGGPPPDWNGPHPGTGFEIYCGKLPPTVFEDVLIPLFEKCGTIWDLRLMMDPVTGQSKSFCFVTFTEKESAKKAVKEFDGYEIKPGKKLKVNVSIAKVRLFVGNIPKLKSKEELTEEFSKHTEGLVDVIIYSNSDDPTKKNRGFAFLEYDSHKSASDAKRRLSSPNLKVFGNESVVSWAEPQEEPGEEVMSKVKVLYIRDLKAEVTEDEIQQHFEKYGKVERVKKAKDYCFVHFEEREHAMKALEEENGKCLGSSTMSISLAKPPSAKQPRRQQQFGEAGMWNPAGHPTPGRFMMGRGRGRVMRPPLSAYDYGYAPAPAFDPYGYDTSYDTGYMEDYSGYGYAEDGGYYGGMGAMGMPRPPMMRGRANLRVRGNPGFPPRGRPISRPGGRGGFVRGRGGPPRGLPVMRGNGANRGFKRKAEDQFPEAAKRIAVQDPWSSQPISQQPLSETAETEWYQDTWS